MTDSVIFCTFVVLEDKQILYLEVPDRIVKSRCSTSNTALTTRFNTSLEQFVKRDNASMSSITTTNRLTKGTNRTSSNTDTSFFRNKAYHTAEDTPDTLDYQRMAQVVDGVMQVVLAEQPR